jgi:hypothetical protein
MPLTCMAPCMPLPQPSQAQPRPATQHTRCTAPHTSTAPPSRPMHHTHPGHHPRPARMGALFQLAQRGQHQLRQGPTHPLLHHHAPHRVRAQRACAAVRQGLRKQPHAPRPSLGQRGEPRQHNHHRPTPTRTLSSPGTQGFTPCQCQRTTWTDHHPLKPRSTPPTPPCAGSGQHAQQSATAPGTVPDETGQLLIRDYSAPYHLGLLHAHR